jgi:hypothetical protein
MQAESKRDDRFAHVKLGRDNGGWPRAPVPRIPGTICDLVGLVATDRLGVCATHGSLYGEWRWVSCPTREEYSDRAPHWMECGCGRKPWAPPEGSAARQRPWGDFNGQFEFCYCCGLEVIPSGTKYSPFHCRECHVRVMNLNRRAGRWLFAIGRASVMHGGDLAADAALDRRRVDAFLDACLELFRTADAQEEWASRVVRQNLADLGFDPRRDVRLEDYLLAVERQRPSKQERFKRMCAGR